MPAMDCRSITGSRDAGAPRAQRWCEVRGASSSARVSAWTVIMFQMATPIGAEAQRPNPALEPLTPLVGQWRTTGTHPLVPGTTSHGRTSFEWHEDGAFMLMRSEIDEPEIPSAVAVVGSDDAAGAFTMIYFDERDISRRYTVEIADGEVRWHRDEAGFAQRMVITIAADGSRLDAQGTMSRNGGPWEDDLQLTYERID